MNLDDRMKCYEDVYASTLMRRTPVILRLDGRAFHTFTKGMGRPFDERLGTCMALAAMAVAEDAQGCKTFYVQSDEASFLLTDYDRHETEPWLGNDVQKMVSFAASRMTGVFNTNMKAKGGPSGAMFDARAFNVPREDVVNYFLWRARDWERNSLQMYCRSVFSHKELNCKNAEAMHNMLHDVGRNWTRDLMGVWRNGYLAVKEDRYWRVWTETKWDYAVLEATLQQSIEQVPTF